MTRTVFGDVRYVPEQEAELEILDTVERVEELRRALDDLGTPAEVEIQEGAIMTDAHSDWAPNLHVRERAVVVTYGPKRKTTAFGPHQRLLAEAWYESERARLAAALEYARTPPTLAWSASDRGTLEERAAWEQRFHAAINAGWCRVTAASQK